MLHTLRNDGRDDGCYTDQKSNFFVKEIVIGTLAHYTECEQTDEATKILIETHIRTWMMN